MKKTLSILYILFISALASAQNGTDDFMARVDAQINDILDKAVRVQNDVISDYENIERKVLEEYEAYCKAVMGKWGDLEMVESTQKDWVEYSEDESSRSIVDFENGKVTVEVLTDPGESEEEVNRQLEKAIGDLLSSKGKAPNFDSELLPQQNVTEDPVLDGQIDLAKYQNNPKNIVKEEKKGTKTVSTEEGKKNIVSIQFELVEDHIPKRAEKFKDMIAKHSKRFDITEPLIYAIIEQESSFNPMARSSAGAYGLMQIVPSSGGLDANRYVHNRNKVPTSEELYRPDFNIELGTGYLKKQMNVYFSGVTDLRCRMLCAIAAYNTGQGNVYYAFTGKRKAEGAFKEINRYSYEQLYEHLKRMLPHAETRDYIQKVTAKMAKYSK